jgi:hypothetical protein
MSHTTRRLHTPPANPIVRETRLRVAPGWVVREFADGMFVAADMTSPAISPALFTFRDAVAWARTPDGECRS